MRRNDRPLPPAFGSYPLPAGHRAQLEAYCDLTGERPQDVLADAVALHLDEVAGELSDAGAQWMSAQGFEPVERDAPRAAAKPATAGEGAP